MGVRLQTDRTNTRLTSPKVNAGQLPVDRLMRWLEQPTLNVTRAQGELVPVGGARPTGEGEGHPADAMIHPAPLPAEWQSIPIATVHLASPVHDRGRQPAPRPVRPMPLPAMKPIHAPAVAEIMSTPVAQGESARVVAVPNGRLPGVGGELSAAAPRAMDEAPDARVLPRESAHTTVSERGRP